MDRNQTLLMKDILEHVQECFDQWQQADARTSRFLVEAIDRDLHEFRRLCGSLRCENHSPPRRTPVPA